MSIKNKKVTMRLVAILLIMALMPIGTRAAVADTVQPCASLYLDSYNSYIYAAGSGKIQVYFSVIGTDYMDELGALTIQIYESMNGSTWTWRKSFTHESTSGMLGYNDFYHSGHVDFQGIAGRFYKAYVCIWAGENGDGDTRYFYTSVKKAT